MSDSEIKRLASVLADWAEPAKAATLYVFGSRVRGDHRLDSDVDVYVAWKQPQDVDLDWWTQNNEDFFRTINARLPGPLQILEADDPLGFSIMRANSIHVDRNVRCVLLPPKNSSLDLTP